MVAVTTSRLKQPLLAAAQAQKHVTVNEGLAINNELVFATALAFAPAPIGSEEAWQDGDGYIVVGGTGPFTGYDDSFVVRRDGGWFRHLPFEGMLVWVSGLETFYGYLGGAWRIAVPPTSEEELHHHVATDGHDYDNDGSEAYPFASVFRAMFTAGEKQRTRVTIHVEDGAYSEDAPVSAGLGMIGFQWMQIIGNPASPGSITGIDFDAFLGDKKSELIIDGFTCSQIVVGGYGGCFLKNIRHIGSGNHIYARHYAEVVVAEKEIIAGNFDRHILVDDSADVLHAPDELTLVSSPVIGEEFASTMFGTKFRSNILSTVGAATGKRHHASLNSIIKVEGDPLPGDVTGTTDTGGQYDGP